MSVYGIPGWRWATISDTPGQDKTAAIGKSVGLSPRHSEAEPIWRVCPNRCEQQPPVPAACTRAALAKPSDGYGRLFAPCSISEVVKAVVRFQHPFRTCWTFAEIGRASGRERVCQYV